MTGHSPGQKNGIQWFRNAAPHVFLLGLPIVLLFPLIRYIVLEIGNIKGNSALTLLLLTLSAVLLLLMAYLVLGKFSMNIPSRVGISRTDIHLRYLTGRYEVLRHNSVADVKIRRDIGFTHVLLITHKGVMKRILTVNRHLVWALVDSG